MSGENKSETDQLSSIKGFQELVRIVDATLHKIDPQGVVTGIGTMQTIQGILERNGLKESLGKDFCDFITQQYNDSLQPDTNDFKPNVREYVKKILFYPNTAYSPWEEIAINYPGDRNRLDAIASTLKFQLRLVDGKIYAMPVPGNNAIDYRIQILNLLKPHLTVQASSGIIVNPEPQHITVINSNIVSDCGLEDVTNFVTKFNETVYPVIHITFDKIKTTVSEDWSLFSRCYVVGIDSPELNNFIEQFNETFKEMLKKPLAVSTHTTFAVLPRSLHLF